MTLTPKQEIRSIGLLRLSGYGLLAYSVLDFVQLLIPMHLMNAEWEFQVIGAMVERVALPLLGFALVFCGERTDLGPIEAALLRRVPPLALAFAVLLLLLIPLGVFDTGRVRRKLDERIATQTMVSDAQMVRLRELREKLDAAETADGITRALASQNIPSATLDFSDFAKLKSALLSDLAQTESRLLAKAAADRTDPLWGLYKNAIKWGLGALLAGAILLRIWWLTRSPATEAGGGLVAVLRIAGWGLLALAAFDFIHGLLPLHPRSWTWRFSLVGNSIDRLPMSLLGLVLLFFGERAARGPAAMLFLRGATYLSLTMAVWFLLLIPWGAVCGTLLHREIAADAEYRLARLRAFKASIAESARPDSPSPPPQDTAALDQQAKAELAWVRQVEASRFESQMLLYRNTGKGILVSLLAGFLFLQIWMRTRWTLRKEETW
jgi:hypothetical protein